MVIRETDNMTLSYINLAEVELYDTAFTKIPNFHLSASRSVAFFQDKPASQCIDGDLNKVCFSQNLAQTSMPPRLVIDYPCVDNRTALSAVLISNTMDSCCTSRIMDFTLEFVNAAGVVDRRQQLFTEAAETYLVNGTGSGAGECTSSCYVCDVLAAQLLQ